MAQNGISYLVELVFSIIIDMHLNLGILGFFSFLQILYIFKACGIVIFLTHSF